MKKFDSSRKIGFLSNIPSASIDDLADTLAKRCKFNFSYFEKQDNGQAFSEWNHSQLVDLIEKLKHFGKEPLNYWRAQPVGKGGKVLSIYGKFPAKSDFIHPKHVPHQAEWGRFRLDWAARLVGFVVPPTYSGIEHTGCGHRFDCNTFYVVFLDSNHCFYKTEAK